MSSKTEQQEQLIANHHQQKEDANKASADVKLAEREEPSESGKDALPEIKDEKELELHPSAINILVVDDEKVTRNVVSRLLKQLGYTVYTAEGGGEALKILKDTDIHLMLLDIMMPDMDGYELLKLSKQAYSTDIPIIMMSGNSDQETVSKSFKCGAEDFLSKPIGKEMLKRRIEMCLEDRIRMQKEKYYKQVLEKERQRGDMLTEQVKEKEKEIERILGQVSEAIETPIQVVMNTIRDLMSGQYKAQDFKGALIAVLKSLGSSDLYKPAFTKLLAGDKKSTEKDLDDYTRQWLIGEYTQVRDNNAPAKEPENVPTDEVNDTYLFERTGHKFLAPKKELTAEAYQSTEMNDVEKHTKFPPTPPPEVLSTLRTFNFDTSAVPHDTMIDYIGFMYKDLGLIDRFKIDGDTLYRFLHEVKHRYKDNPYHNFTHALDVTQFVYAALCDVNIASIYSDIDKFAGMVAATCHDIDHPGLNNNYHINAQSELALVYNDISILENYHCSLTFKILRSQQFNLLCHLTPQEFKEMRHTVIQTILATDMSHHFEFVTKFQTRSQTGALSRDSKDDRQLLMSVVMKCADISNSVRPIHVSVKWADFLLAEFFSQGDLESSQGMPISPMMDRRSINKPKMQMNFVDFVAEPLYKALVTVFPTTQVLTDNIYGNRNFWKNVHEQELQQQQQPQVPPQQIAAVSKEVDIRRDSTDSTASNTPVYGELDESKFKEPKSKNIKILIVEDDPTCLKIAKRMLEKAGYICEAAENGKIALAKVESEKPDLILMDCQMPEMDGYTATKFIREREAQENSRKTDTSQHKHVPIVAITAFGMEITREKCIKSGMDLCLSKPIHKKDLLSVIEKWTEAGGVAAENTKENNSPVVNTASSTTTTHHNGSPANSSTNSSNGPQQETVSSKHTFQPQLIPPNEKLIDIEQAKEQCGGEEEFLADLFVEFVEMTRGQIDNIRQLYISKTKLDVIEREAHSMKGASLVLSAVPLAISASNLEKFCKSILPNQPTNPQWAMIEDLLQSLETQYLLLVDHLRLHNHLDN